MNSFYLPFSIGYPNTKDYVLAKCYEEKKESYRLIISAKKQLHEPIRITFRSSAKILDLSLQIELGKGASATLIEEWDNDLQSSIVHFKNHIKCHENSVMTYIILHNTRPTTETLEQRTSDTDDDAECHIYGYYFGGKKLLSHLTQKASGKGADIKSNMMIKATNKRHFSLTCNHLFTAKLGTGEIKMKGVAQDEATLNFEGLVSIDKNGASSAGYLKQEVLNLSSRTSVTAVPGLKIETSDVKAGHSASVQNLNDEDLFYFGARGIEKEAAKKILITGFLGSELKGFEKCENIFESIRNLI